MDWVGGGGGAVAAENSSGGLHGWMHGLFIQRISAGELRAGLRAEAGWETAVRTPQPAFASIGGETSARRYRGVFPGSKGHRETPGRSKCFTVDPDSWPRFLLSHQLFIAFVYFQGFKPLCF